MFGRKEYTAVFELAVWSTTSADEIDKSRTRGDISNRSITKK
jgi:hypothetical protein